MDSKEIAFYLHEAKPYAGKNHIQPDGSDLGMVQPSELLLKYEQIRKNVGQPNDPGRVPKIARKWSATPTTSSTECRTTIPAPQDLRLRKLDILRRDRYLTTHLCPEDLQYFPFDTLGGAFFQYMCHGEFYEFDKNPKEPESEIEWFMHLLRQTHDFYHLVTEIYHYGWDGGYLAYDPELYLRDRLVLSEEMCIYAFIMGQVRLKAVIPIVAEWAINAIFYSRQWLKDAYSLWLQTQNSKSLEKFGFSHFIGDCEQFMYASFKLGCLEKQVCVDEYLQALDENLQKLAPEKRTVEEREYQDMVLESFERGLRSKPLICFQWECYLSNTLQEVREFLNIPQRKLFKEGSYYLDADLYLQQA
ncbi:hypothetical protein [Roseofilum casamattae]|uniref:Uncharacterized protein n=1 Tax=Roseofilum casamattae BLCC-M143 TaxID=3022442 RepID=A0ABT7C2M0_9CYAN|nr:hypothetical protein [Roseofilum casamattae]MDJ1185665.1 hypothetical protein [Roseofilum casamattae BLCC-M143]